MQAFDRRMDRIFIARPRLHCMQRSKNYFNEFNHATDISTLMAQVSAGLCHLLPTVGSIDIMNEFQFFWSIQDLHVFNMMQLTQPSDSEFH